MKYSMVSTFFYDEDDGGLLSRLERLFKLKFFENTVLRPKSDRLPPTRSNLQHILEPDGYQSSDFRFVVNRGQKSLRGTLSITKNSVWAPLSFTSYLELSFSLSAGYKGGPFHSANEIRDIMLACVQVGSSPMSYVETGDASHELRSANFQRFRIIDSMAVPVTIEWVSLFHKDVVSRMQVDLLDAAAAANVLAGQQGEYWWIILTEEPFSFSNPAHSQRYQAIREAVGLESIHAKFPRN